MFFHQVQNYYLPTILLQQCMVGLLNRFSNHCANNVLCFFISKHGFFSPHLLKNIFAMHVNSTELMNAELNLLMDAPVVTSASCHPAGFPHTRRHIFHSAWPGPQALPPASSPCWVITTIPFAPPFYTINCEAGKQDLYQCIGIYMLLKKCYNRAKEYQNRWTEA